MVGHGGSSAGSYLPDPTSPIPSHCASIVATSTLRVKLRCFQLCYGFKICDEHIGISIWSSGLRDLKTLLNDLGHSYEMVHMAVFLLLSATSSMHRQASLPAFDTLATTPTAPQTAVGGAKGGTKAGFIMPKEPPTEDQWVPDSEASVCMVCNMEHFGMVSRQGVLYGETH